MTIVLIFIGAVILSYLIWQVIHQIDVWLHPKRTLQQQLINNFETNLKLDNEFYEIYHNSYQSIKDGYETYGFEEPADKNLAECKALFAKDVQIMDQRIGELKACLAQLNEDQNLPVNKWQTQLNQLITDTENFKTTLQKGPFA